MVYTSLHYLDTSDTEWQVAHLFEHLVVGGFYRSIRDRGKYSELVGWVDADTFEDKIFLDAGFYSQETQNLFESYLKALPDFTDEHIDYGLATLQAEDKIEITVYDKAALHQELVKLSQRAWDTSVDPTHPGGSKQLLSIRKNAKKFRDVTIVTHANGLTDEEQKLFLRFSVIITDTITAAFNEIPGVYLRGHSPVLRHDADMAFMAVYTFTRNDVSLKDIEDAIKVQLAALDLANAMPAIRDHFKVYAANPMWKAMSVDYYRSTGIVTSTDEVASLLAEDRLRSLMTKLMFTVRQATSHDKDHI